METVLVCVTVQKECERLILAGRRFAEAEGLPLRVLHVMDEGKQAGFDPAAQEVLNHLYALSRDAHAEMTILRAQDVRQTIADYARKNGAVCVIVGSDKRGDWAMAEDLLELLDDRITVMKA